MHRPVRHLMPFAAAVATALAFGVVPAAATTGVTDPCGDADSRAYALGEQAVLEDGIGHVDLSGGGVAPILDEEAEVVLGIEAAIEVCGEASTSDGGYGISWGIGDGCYQQLGWTLRARDDVSAATRQPGEDEVDIATQARPIFQEYCFVETPDDPVRGNEVQTTFRVGLPADAVAFDGASLRFTIPNELVPDTGTVPALGDVFAHPTLVAMDQTASTSTVGGSSTLGGFGAWVRTDIAAGADVVLG